MLTSLHISNFALIDALDIEFGGGLSIVTGETGAGKSIILGALSLLLGSRADTKAVSDKTRKTVVEATFLPASPLIASRLANFGYEPDEADGTFILRREISVTGRSRAFINDSPVTLAELSQAADILVDIHSQHRNLSIADGAYRLGVVDAYGSLDALRKEYEGIFRSYVHLRQKVKNIKDDIRKSRENEEFIRFQLGQLDEFSPRRGEQTELERRYEILTNVEAIRGKLTEALTLISPSVDDSACDRLSRALGAVQTIPADFFAQDGDPSPVKRLENVIVELRDLASLFDSHDLSVSGGRELEAIDARLNALYRLQVTFHLSNEDELCELHESLKEKVKLLSVDSETLPKLEEEMRLLGVRLKEAAGKLTAERKKSADSFSLEMEERCRLLGLKNIVFNASVTPGKLGMTGGDTVDFLVSFNKNMNPRPVEKAASGGEVSRLMLSLKSIVAGRMALPTVIFDEIDTGVSGEIADRMGEMMRQIAGGIQVITITHLPQVAAKADTHFKVYKQDTDTRTVTRLVRLSEEEHLREVARLLSGAELNEAALMNARELIKNARR